MSHHKLNNFCLTVNNQSKDEFLGRAAEWAEYVFGGIEKAPSTGKIHLQVFAQSRWTPKRIGKRYGYHVELCRGTIDQNIAYCSKDGNTFEFGRLQRDAQGARNDLVEIMSTLRDGATPCQVREQWPAQFFRYQRHVESCFASYHNSRHPYRRTTVRYVCLYLGSSGSGKTTAAFDNERYEMIYGGLKYLSAYRIANQDNTMWWKGYEGQDFIILDDFKGGMKLNTLLGILDPWYNTDISLAPSVLMRMAASKVIITSTMTPNLWYPNQDISELLRRISFIRRFGSDMASITHVTSPQFSFENGNAPFYLPKEIVGIINEYVKW